MRLGLGQRLNITIVPLFIFFCLVFMAINLIYFWSESKKHFYTKINHLANFSAESNSANIWNFDTENIDKLIKSLIYEDSLVGIVFETQNFKKNQKSNLYYGTILGKSINQEANRLEMVAPEKKMYTHHLERKIIHSTLAIGTVHLYFSDRHIYIEAVKQGRIFIFNLVVFAFFYSVSIYFVLKKQLLVPLMDIHRLALSVSGLTASLREKVSYERWKNIQHLLAFEKITQSDFKSTLRNDELGDLQESFFLVLNGFEFVVSELSQYSEQLQFMNVDLESRIANRTIELEESHKKVSESLYTLQQTQSQLTQQEKLASIGQLAAGVAHEINNPIGYVGSNINRLKEYFDDLTLVVAELEKMATTFPAEIAPTLTTEIKKIKEKIDYQFLLDDFSSVISESQEGIARVKDIVQSLKDFSHNSDDNNFSDANINDAIKTTLKVVNNELKYNCNVTLDLQLNKLVSANLGQIHQVVSNIIINASHAIKATGHLGQLTIQTFGDDDFAYIKISDTGAGIPENIHSKIFDPFFTTKPIGQGTGLGLNICYDIIVNKHNGELSLESQVGIGTTFTIKLPILHHASKLYS